MHVASGLGALFFAKGFFVFVGAAAVSKHVTVHKLSSVPVKWNVSVSMWINLVSMGS